MAFAYAGPNKICKFRNRLKKFYFENCTVHAFMRWSRVIYSPVELMLKTFGLFPTQWGREESDIRYGNVKLYNIDIILLYLRLAV